MFLRFISAVVESGFGFESGELPSHIRGSAGRGSVGWFINSWPLVCSPSSVIYRCSVLAATSEDFNCFIHFVCWRSIIYWIVFTNVWPTVMCGSHTPAHLHTHPHVCVRACVSFFFNLWNSTCLYHKKNFVFMFQEWNNLNKEFKIELKTKKQLKKKVEENISGDYIFQVHSWRSMMYCFITVTELAKVFLSF